MTRRTEAPPVRLICFDVDGTLVVHPEEKVVWEVLNKDFGTKEEVNQERYRRFKAGELSYKEFARQTGNSEQGARALHYRGLKHLRKLLTQGKGAGPS